MPNDEEIRIKYGTSDEYNEAEHDDNDIVFLTDMPIIKAKGRTYGGNGVPTWNGESRAYSDPVILFKELYKILKKPLYMADKKCPKFDINIYQKWTRISTADGIKEGWIVSDNLRTYKMIYDSNETTFAHLTNKQKNGELVVFTFTACKGSRFFITQCEEKDWLCSDGTHNYLCPGWNNETHTYKKTYGYSKLESSSQAYAKKYNGTLTSYDVDGEIQLLRNCKVKVVYKVGQTESDYNVLYPKITISLTPID